MGRVRSSRRTAFLSQVVVADKTFSPPIAYAGLLIEGRYHLSRQIGRGSTGTVWDGQDLVTGQAVAVKILHGALLTSPAARSRFHREVQSAQSLNHPNSVRVLAQGQTPDGSEYLVMERLLGRTLSALLADAGPLPQLRAIRIVAQILDAMAAAHRLKIVHRDLKPSNVILVTSDETIDFVKVCDFGLAKVVDPHETDDEEDADRLSENASLSTGQGELCGTPEYMAPEQARGEVLDGRADLYSIAVILFQAVAGRVPFQGRTPLTVISLHLSAAPPRPASIRPDLAPALEQLILRGLAKDRRERPSSAEVFRADLLQIERDLLRDLRKTARQRGKASEHETLPTPTSEGPVVWRAPAARRMAVVALVLVGAIAALSAVIVRRREPLVSHALAPSRPPRVFPSVPSLNPSALSARTTNLHVDPPRPATSGSSGSLGPHPSRVGPHGASSIAGDLPPRGRTAPIAERAQKRLPVAALKPPATNDERSIEDPDQTRPTGVVEEPTITPQTIIQKAEDLLADGQVAKACAVGETAVNASPRLALARGFLGRCYMRLGQPEKAKTSYGAYLELAPGAPDAPFVRAMVSRKRP